MIFIFRFSIFTVLFYLFFIVIDIKNPAYIIAGSNENNINQGSASLKVYSIPDKISVYVSPIDKEGDIFIDKNYVGLTPISLDLSKGNYQVGFLTNDISGSKYLYGQFSLGPIYTPVMIAIKGETFVNSGIMKVGKKRLEWNTVQPNRMSMTAEESEPYICDLDVGLRSIPADQSSDLSILYYRINEGIIKSIGNVYRVDIGQEPINLVGMILPSNCLPTSKQIQKLHNFYPNEKRFDIRQSYDEIKEIFRSQLIPEASISKIVNLLEKGGKFIYSGERVNGKIHLKDNTKILYLDKETTKNDLRTVIVVNNGRILVDSYISGIIHSVDVDNILLRR